MTDFTREKLVQEMTIAAYNETADTHDLPWGQLSETARNTMRQPMAIALATILANARIVPPEVTDEMVRNGRKAIIDHADYTDPEARLDGIFINAGIDAGKL